MASNHKMTFLVVAFWGFLSACATHIEVEPNTAVQIYTWEEFLQERSQTLDLMVRGTRLPEEKAKAAEAKLLSSPDDVESRILLIVYYTHKQHQSAAYRLVRQRHVLWLIENAPANVVFLYRFADLSPEDGEAYTQSIALWKQQASAHSRVPIVLVNAARFFEDKEESYSITLLEKAEALAPEHPEWKWRLGLAYARRSQSGSEEWRQSQARLAFQKLEASYERIPAEPMRAHRLPAVAKAAFSAKEWEKAKRYADQLLAIAKDSTLPECYQQAARNFSSTPTQQICDGQAVHDGNLVLGRLALLQGDVSAAKAYLLAAAKTPGSIELTSHGPNMSLARELLEAGERETVLKYLELCHEFWRRSYPTLNNWITAVQAGEIPDFGKHLFL